MRNKLPSLRQMRTRLMASLLFSRSSLEKLYVFIGGKLIVGSVEVILILVNVGCEIDF